MTIKKLSQLYWLSREIEMDIERLKKLNADITFPKPYRMDGMPHASIGKDTMADCVAEIADLKAIIKAKQKQCIHERNRLERYIKSIPDSLMRQIFTLRFVDGLSWYQVAESIGGGNTVSGIRSRVYRYLGK